MLFRVISILSQLEKLRTSSLEFQDPLDMFQRWEHKNENVLYIVLIEANRFDKNGIFNASSSTI